MENAHPRPGEDGLQKPDTQTAHIIDLSPEDAAAASSESPCIEPQVAADTSSESEADVNSEQDEDSMYEDVLSDDQEEFPYATGMFTSTLQPSHLSAGAFVFAPRPLKRRPQAFRREKIPEESN
jgi:hypothetical protein